MVHVLDQNWRRLEVNIEVFECIRPRLAHGFALKLDIDRGSVARRHAMNAIHGSRSLPGAQTLAASEPDYLHIDFLIWIIIWANMVECGVKRVRVENGRF